MTTPARPPLPRIGDAERDDAVTLLQEHMADGRLDHDEFTQRMTTALTARTQADLDPLFVDLPGRRPGRPGAAAPAPSAPSLPAPTPLSATPARRRPPLLWVLAAVAVVAIVGLAAVNWQHWWLFVMIPIFLTFGGHRSRCGRR